MVTWFNILSDNYKNGGSHFGFNSGLIFQYAISENYSFSTGISIRSNSGKLRFSNTDSLLFSNKYRTYYNNDLVLIKIQYIDIPLGMKFMTNQYGRFDFFAELGLDMMIRVKAMARSDEENNDSGYDARDFVRGFNVGYFLGGGIDYALTENTTLFTGLKFSNGLMNLTKLHSSRLAANALIFSLGILF